MYKKILFVVSVVTVVVLAACGGREETARTVWFEMPEAVDSPYWGEENLIVPRNRPRPTPAPVHDEAEGDENIGNGSDVETLPSLLPLPQPEPLPAPHLQDTILFESGFLGVKFEVADLPVFDLYVWNRGALDMPLISHRHADIGENVTLYIGRSTTRPAMWDEEFWGVDEPFSRALYSWQHPAASGETATTESGLTVVKYERDLPLPWTWPHLDGQQALYIFREDGRNYLENCESSAFFYIFFSAPVEQFEELHPYVLELLESIRFLDGSQIRYRHTPAAAALAITGANFPLIDGATSARYLTAHLLRAMFYHPADIGQTEAARNYVPWRTSRTVPSYRRLIAGEVDLIFVPQASDYVLALAEEAGVTLEFFHLAADYYAVIREDSPADAPQRRIIGFLLSEDGKYIVENAGLGRSRITV